MKLHRQYVEKVWGREDLPPAFDDGSGRRIGEIWYDDDGRNLPILVKYLFTSEKLSIQVHPSDEQARAAGLPSGKEECWYVLRAEPGATIGVGTRRPLSNEELRAASQNGQIEQLMDWKAVQPGDFFYLKAGTVHAIGAGITLIEIQQNADITYRLYDYGRPRELHLDEGVAVADARPFPEPLQRHVDEGADQRLVDGPKFRLQLCGPDLADIDTNSPLWIVPLSGTAAAGGAEGTRGDCLYADDRGSVQASDDARLLIAWEGA